MSMSGPRTLADMQFTGGLTKAAEARDEVQCARDRVRVAAMLAGDAVLLEMLGCGLRDVARAARWSRLLMFTEFGVGVAGEFHRAPAELRGWVNLSAAAGWRCVVRLRGRDGWVLEIVTPEGVQVMRWRAGRLVAGEIHKIGDV